LGTDKVNVRGQEDFIRKTIKFGLTSFPKWKEVNKRLNLWIFLGSLAQRGSELWLYFRSTDSLLAEGFDCAAKAK